LNGHSLGSFKSFIWQNNTLSYVTTGGEACGSGTYQLNASFACDKTLNKGYFDVPSFTATGESKCAVTTVVRSRYACRVPELNTGANGIYNIKCISGDIYEREQKARDR
jgi:hypothetical protein